MDGWPLQGSQTAYPRRVEYLLTYLLNNVTFVCLSDSLLLDCSTHNEVLDGLSKRFIECLFGAIPAILINQPINQSISQSIMFYFTEFDRTSILKNIKTNLEQTDRKYSAPLYSLIAEMLTTNLRNSGSRSHAWLIIYLHFLKKIYT